MEIKDLYSDSGTEFVGVTVDVCRQICVTLSSFACNGFLYMRASKKCRLTSEDFTRIQKVQQRLVARQGHDFYRRLRCESKLSGHAMVGSKIAAQLADKKWNIYGYYLFENSGILAKSIGEW